MAQIEIQWDSLPEPMKNLNAYLQIIAQVMARRFPTDGGFRHQVIGNTEYRVRRGLFEGWDVRVWRQNQLIVNVSSGSRFSSGLPIIAGVLAAIAMGIVENTWFSTANIPISGAARKIGYLWLALWTVMFLVIWGALGLVLRFPFGTQHGLDQDLLMEIRKSIPGETRQSS